jgi:hypothetical protein
VTLKKTVWIFATVVALLTAACGGGVGDVGDLGGEVFEGIGEASGDVESGDQGSGGATEIGPVTQTADPSTGWVEVDGQRHEFSAFGSIHYTCEVMEDRITINFQETTAGSSFGLQGAMVDGQWNASLTFVPGEQEAVQYGASIGFDPGVFGIGGNEISFEGTMSRVEDRDIVNAQDVQGAFAVNCAAPGGDPTAEIGGQAFTFPLSGGNSVDCAISDQEVAVLIGRNRPEFVQLQVDISNDDGTYTSFVPPDGTGLEIDGASLTYEGIFTTPDGSEVEGSVSVSCG